MQRLCVCVYPAPCVDMASSSILRAVDESGDRNNVLKQPAPFNLEGLIKRVPQINKSGNSQDDNARTMVLLGFIKLLSIFANDPSKILDALNTVQMGMCVGTNSQTKDCDRWPSTYTKVGRLPKYWKAALIADASGGEMSKELLSKVDSKDEQAIEMMFSLFTQTILEVYLPRLCLVKATCKRFFEARHKDCGSRMRGWAKKAIRDDGTIDWVAGCPYQLLWATGAEDAKATQVEHISGDIADLPPYLSVTRAFKCESPHRDMEARLAKDNFAFSLSDLFKEDLSGPWKFRMSGKEKDKKDDSNPFNMLVQVFEREFSEHLRQKEAGAELCDDTLLNANELNRKATKRAAAKQRATQQASKRKRTMKF